MAGTVTSQLINITNAESADSANWDDIGGGQGSVQDADIFVQGSNARGRRIDNTTNKGMSYDTTTEVNLSAVGTHLGLWVNVLQPAQLTSLEVQVGNASTPQSSPYWSYDLFSTDYPKAGGFQRVWISNNTRSSLITTLGGSDGWRRLRQFGIAVDIGDVGGNAKNVQVDSIDYTRGGLLVASGTAGSPATFADFVTADTAYGVVIEEEGVIFCLAGLTIGDATATVFNDSGTVIAFAKQAFVAPDFMGVTVDLQNGSTDVDFNNITLLSGGTGDENRGILTVTTDAAGGTFDAVGCSFLNLNRVLLKGVGTFASSTFSKCGQIDVSRTDWDGEMALDRASSEYVKTTTNVDVSSASNDFEVMVFAEANLVNNADIGLVSLGGDTPATQAFIFQWFEQAAGDMLGSPFRLQIGDGTATTIFTPSVTPLFVHRHTNNGPSLWLRAKYDHSAGSVEFFYSEDPANIPYQDVSWEKLGATVTGTARAMPSSNARPILIGARNDVTPADFIDGTVSFAAMWTDGFSDTVDPLFVADWRTGPDFTSGTRADDYNSAITWQEQGTSPTYTTATAAASTAATLAGCTVSNSTSYAALRWDVNTDPAGELDDMAFQMGATGHAIELGPSCPSTIGLNGQTYVGYAAIDGSGGDEVIYNNSGKAVTINVGSGGDTPSVRNGVGASTTVNNTVTYTFTNLKNHSEVTLLQGAVELLHVENVAVIPREASYTYNFTGAASATLLVEHPNYEQYVAEVELGGSDASLRVEQEGDRVYDNPPGANPGTDGLNGWWDFVEGDTPWYSEVGEDYFNGLHDSVAGDWVRTEVASSGTVVFVGGNSESIESNESTPHLTSGFTAGGWFADSEVAELPLFAIYDYDAASDLHTLYVKQTGKYDAKFSNSAEALTTITGPATPDYVSDGFSFYAIRQNGKSLSLFQNGEETATGTLAGTPWTGNIYYDINTDGNGDQKVSNFFHYSRALSDDEIRYLYNFGEGREFADVDVSYNPGTQGLLHWWELNETGSPTTWLDSHGDADLTKYNTVTSTGGVVAGGASFDKVSKGHLKTTLSQPGNDFHAEECTVSFWMNFPSSALFGLNDIFRVEKSGLEPTIFFQYLPGSDRLYFSRYSEIVLAEYDQVYANNFSEGAWTHVVGVVRNNFPSLYINGVKRNDVSYDWHDTRSLKMGGEVLRLGEDGLPSDPVELDEICVYSRALSDDEILYLYNDGAGRSYDDVRDSEYKPKKGGLVAWWDHEETGVVATGVDSHSTWDLTKGPVGNPSGIAGLIGGGVQIPMYGYLETSVDFPQFQREDFSIGGWLRFDESPLSLTFVKNGEVRLFSDTVQTGKITFRVRVDGIDEYAYGDEVLSTGVWHHVVGVRRGEYLEVYVNGVKQQVSGVVSAPGDVGKNTWPLEWGPAMSIKSLDSTFVYDYALPRREIEWLYNDGKGRSYSDL